MSESDRRRMRIAILGATGSIGRSTLDVAARHPDRFEVFALTANSQAGELAQLCAAHRPAYAVIADASRAGALAAQLAAGGLRTRVLAGEPGLIEVAAMPDVDCVMAAIVGAAGLRPTLAAAQAGKKLLLANKEALVMAGPIFMGAVRANGVTLLPIDSEHNAIFQCLPAGGASHIEQAGVRRILLTGSGGPFRTRRLTELASVTPDEACAHPNWTMGRKISVDSATMMNKGLELVEAHWLFDAAPERIEILVHPQSVVHSMVEYADGSVIAQLGNPDMRTPIAQALAYPERIAAGVQPLDLAALGALTFERPDFERFRALALAYEVLRSGGTAPAIFNAANEVAVDAFLRGAIAFTRITDVIEAALGGVPASHIRGLEDVLEADRAARAFALNRVRSGMLRSA
jgi:1-deoxy-D-xylulose-5-phosphate reductoisomerase